MRLELTALFVAWLNPYHPVSSILASLQLTDMTWILLTGIRQIMRVCPIKLAMLAQQCGQWPYIITTFDHYPARHNAMIMLGE